jgi:hypothetical protein
VCNRSDERAVEVKKQAEANMPTDIPVLPNIQAEAPSPDLIKYQISAGAREAALFYQAEMPKNQWVASQQHLVRPDMAVLSYAKENRRATIIIHQDGRTGTRIMITVTALGETRVMR